MAVGFQSSIYEGDLDDYRLNWYSEIYIVKYTSDNSKRFFPKVPIIRLSEMYLIAAEGWMEDDPGHAAGITADFQTGQDTERGGIAGSNRRRDHAGNTQRVYRGRSDLFNL